MSECGQREDFFRCAGMYSGVCTRVCLVHVFVCVHCLFVCVGTQIGFPQK